MRLSRGNRMLIAIGQLRQRAAAASEPLRDTVESVRNAYSFSTLYLRLCTAERPQCLLSNVPSKRGGLESWWDHRIGGRVCSRNGSSHQSCILPNGVI